MTEKVLGDAGGTDDFVQLAWFNISSFWLIILKNAATLWQIAAVLGLIAGWKYVMRGGKSKVPAKKKKYAEEDEGDEFERRSHHSRGRSPRHGDRD